MVRFLLQATRGFRFKPWDSPYLRWRVETYAGIRAESIDATIFFRFVWAERKSLWTYLKWVRKLPARATPVSSQNARSYRKQYLHGPFFSPRIKPEVMSPAGYSAQLRAAIEAGADSVYFGLKHFTARAKVGFELEELPKPCARCTGAG